jgi:hypothetical protein
MLKMNNDKKDNMSCEKHQLIHEYSHLQEFIDNLPYIMMIFLGAVIFFVSIGTSFWGYIAAGLYILYGVVGTFWIIIFVCPYCHYFDTRLCPCGYGRIAAKFQTRKGDNLFIEKFKKNIPVIVPLWIAPIVAGGTFLILNFSLRSLRSPTPSAYGMLTLIVLFAVNSFIILPLISRKYGCAHCPQRDTCPWMRSEGLIESIRKISISRN